MKVVLGWLVGEEEGGEYKCEVSCHHLHSSHHPLLQVTYLGGQGPISCPVVQGLGRLVVVRPPTRVQLLVLDTQDTAEDTEDTQDTEDSEDSAPLDVTNTTLGPYPEDSLVRLQCVATGGSPPPDIFWYIGDRCGRCRVGGESHELRCPVQAGARGHPDHHRGGEPRDEQPRPGRLQAAAAGGGAVPGGQPGHHPAGSSHPGHQPGANLHQVTSGSGD